MNLYRSMKWLAGVVLAGGACTCICAQQDVVRFVQPTQQLIQGMADVEVAAPADTAAVRLYLDGTETSELTNAYALATKTAPVWHTILSTEWAAPGRHTLEAVATTSRGKLSASMQVTFAPRAGEALTLDGSWRFASAEDLPLGSLDGAVPPVAASAYIDSAWPKVAVPNSIDAVDQRWMNPHGLLGVYRRTFQVSAADLKDELYLNSASCFWSCRYFVNGKEVGSSIGGYLPRRMLITHAVHPGENSIAVIIDSRSATMGVFSRLRYYYWNYSGLLQDISIERLAPCALAEFRAQGSADGTLTIFPIAVNTTGHDSQLAVAIDVLDPESHLVLHEKREIQVPASGGDTSTVLLKITKPALWDLDHPRLYTVKLHEGDRSLTEKTGFRDIAIQNGNLTLNGEPVLGLQGFDRHADYPGLGKSQPDALADREIKMLHDKGFRIFRPAHYPTTEAELNAADKYGMLVLEEINVTGLDGDQLKTPAVIDFAESQLKRMIARDRSHPSIFAWSIGNENRTDQPGSDVYVRDLIAYGKKLDPTRPFTEVSAQLRNDICYSYMDFLAVNLYAGWYTDKVSDVVPELDALAAYAGNKPMVITEYGAEAVAGRPGTGKGTEYYQAYIVDGYNRFLRDRPHFIGKMYWTSTEFVVGPKWSGGNPNPVPPFHTKGLLTYYRQPKLAWRVMFSPIEMEKIPVIYVGEQPASERTIEIVLHNHVSHPVSGKLLVSLPPGVSLVPGDYSFTIAPEGTASMKLHVAIAQSPRKNLQGMVRAVIDSETEAMPQLLEFRSACSMCTL